MRFRTDLALELVETGDGKLPEGVGLRRSEGEGYVETFVDISTPAAARRLGRARGHYITLETPVLTAPSFQKEPCARRLAERLRELLPEGDVLVAGLGNRRITPDAVGPLAAASILATRHLPPEARAVPGLGGLRSVCVLTPGVMGETGIETGELLAAVCRRLHPAAVIVVDALAAAVPARLGATLQLADSGIEPGAGVLNRRKELSRRTLGVPVLSLGVPTVVDAARFLPENAPEADLPALFLTPRDVDLLVERAAAVLALAVNLALQPQLSPEELEGLVG